MGHPYTEYRYLFPPRPETAQSRDALVMYDNRGWLYQAKMNGTCTVIFTDGEHVIFKTRRENEDHRQWNPLPQHVEFFRAATQRGTWSVYVGELVHNKTRGMKNKLFIFDVLVSSGSMLDGETLKRRLERLEQLMPGKEDELWHRVYDEYVVRVRNFQGDSARGFDILTQKPEVEGIVLKNPTTPLVMPWHAKSNVTGMVKCRRPTKGYPF